MSDFGERQLHGRLWLIRGPMRYPVCINENGYLQVLFGDTEGECFTITMLSHPDIGGETAFEFRSAAGRQITGAGKNVLREAAEEMPVPGPAYRIIREELDYEGYPNLHRIKLQTLDSRFISANKREVVSTTKKVKAFSWWSIHPYEDVENYATLPSDLLRMLEPSEAEPSEFILELIGPDGNGED
ncbi:hypothetical protein IAE39_000273 [Pseudomonas sp. S37]|uniref:hypothetical protein n=1 Tax=Pseudomonas sp. S37 TaxID=2767449 RepID=UPI0019113515|nr:hypothetical protein [Pseudomonas sp. S37]MBK4992099.1 hypothetical protein [Pseudomonas sp. S37]